MRKNDENLTEKPLMIHAKKIANWGWVWVGLTDRGVAQIGLSKPPYVTKPNKAAHDAMKRIEKYLLGKTKNIAISKIDFLKGTPFQKRLWQNLQKIPFGEVRSYGWMAKQLGKPKASRAVGGACGANPLPLLIPCHRVVAGNGKLGGFSSGLQNKKRLLQLEKICLAPTGKIS